MVAIAFEEDFPQPDGVMGPAMEEWRAFLAEEAERVAREIKKISAAQKDTPAPGEEKGSKGAEEDPGARAAGRKGQGKAASSAEERSAGSGAKRAPAAKKRHLEDAAPSKIAKTAPTAKDARGRAGSSRANQEDVPSEGPRAGQGGDAQTASVRGGRRAASRRQLGHNLPAETVPAKTQAIAVDAVNTGLVAVKPADGEGTEDRERDKPTRAAAIRKKPLPAAASKVKARPKVKAAPKPKAQNAKRKAAGKGALPTRSKKPLRGPKGRDTPEVPARDQSQSAKGRAGRERENVANASEGAERPEEHGELLMAAIPEGAETKTAEPEDRGAARIPSRGHSHSHGIGGEKEEEEGKDASFLHILPTKEALQSTTSLQLLLQQEVPLALPATALPKTLRLSGLNKKRNVRASQSFVGLSKDELREKNTKLHDLLLSLKSGLQKAREGEKEAKSEDPQRKAEAEGERETSDSLQKLKASIINPRAARREAPQDSHDPPKRSAAPNKAELAGRLPAMDSSDDDAREQEFCNKSWVNSPSLSAKVRAQNENRISEVFGDGDVRVNLGKMFFGWGDLPKDSPNQFR